MTFSVDMSALLKGVYHLEFTSDKMRTRNRLAKD